MTLTVFFTPPSQGELLSLSPEQLKLLLFSCSEPSYDDPEAIERFWQRHICRQPAFETHSRELNPLWSVWHPTSLWNFTLANPGPWDGLQLEAASLTTDLIGHLPGLLQLAAVLGALAHEAPIQMVIGDNLTHPWTTGQLPYAAIPIAAAALLNTQGIRCGLRSDPTAAISLIKGLNNLVDICRSEALDSLIEKRQFPALTLQEPAARFATGTSIIDLSYLRDPQYFLNTCISEHPGPNLILYNQLAGLWGNVQAPDGTQQLTYTYSHVNLDDSMLQQCKPLSEAFTLEPLPALPDKLRHYTELLNQALPDLLLPLVAAWRQASDHLAVLQEACPLPSWIATADVVSPLLLALRRRYGQSTPFQELPHSFTNEPNATAQMAQRVSMDCPITPSFSSQRHQIVQPLAQLVRPSKKIDCVPRKYLKILERSGLAQSTGDLAQTSVGLTTGPLRIAVFLNQECYYGYFYSDPCALIAMLAAFVQLLERAELDYRLAIIPKSRGPIATFRSALLRQFIADVDRITVYQRSDYSDSNPDWFRHFDINLFSIHGSINLEAALSCLPTYVFLSDLTPVALGGNYTAGELSPRFILPADQPHINMIFNPQQIRLEAERQFEHALNQADLFRPTAPRILHHGQDAAVHG